jgi:hypothetical protein
MRASIDPRIAFVSGALTAIIAFKLVHFNRQRQPLTPSKPSEATLDSVRVTPNRLEAEAMISAVGSSGAGAIVTFSGVTRDNFNGRCVVRLE